MSEEENEPPGPATPPRKPLRLVEPSPDQGRRPQKRTVDGGPYPDPRTAFWLTLAGVLGTGFVGVFFFDLGLLPAIGIGHALAVGSIASLAARRIPEPQAERIGLRGFDPSALPMILCLIPAILVVSELDNFAADWSTPAAETAASDPMDFGQGQEITVEIVGDETGRGDSYEFETEGQESIAAEPASGEGDATDAPDAGASLGIDTTDPWTIAQAFVISVGIAPLVDEFFFRGVIQQSMVVRLGLMRGVAFVALLYTVFHLPAFPELPRLLMGLVSSFGLGFTLGLVRAATGSILAPILLASLWSSVGVTAMVLRDRVPLPGMNVDGTHLPSLVAIFSFAIFAWAIREVAKEARRWHAQESFD